MPALVNLMVTGDHPVPVGPAGETYTINVTSGSSVYYSDSRQVSSTNKLGTLAVGLTASFTTPMWILSSGTSAVLVSLTDTSAIPSGGLQTGATPGVYLPPDWGQFWKPKRNAAAAGTGKATLAVVGDSVAQGLYASNPNTKGMIGVLASQLQALYGDGGSGYFNGAFSPAGMIATAFPGAVQTNYNGKGLPAAQTGTWAWGALSGLLGGGNLACTAAASTITFVVRGTSVTLYYLSNAAWGTINWTIDGVAQTAINTNAAQGTNKVTVSGLSSGNHTVVITQPGTANISPLGVSGENATGVVVNNYSVAGAQSGNYNDNGSVWGVGWNGGRSYPADCLIYALHANDAANTIAGDAWEKNARQFLSGVKETTNGATDIIFLMHHIGTYDTGQTFQDYVARVRGLAESYGAALINMWRLGRNTWQYNSTLGYWCVADGTGGAGSDAVHLSDVGHANTTAQLLPILTAA